MVRLTEGLFSERIIDSEPVKQFTWQTDGGISITVISYGAIVQAIKVPDKNGVIADVALGFDNIDDYINKNVPHFGSTIGRCANRIGGATFEIDGVIYHVAKNVNGRDHLHGGINGFDKFNWKSYVNGDKVIFSYYSKDGEENYPGDLITNVTYELRDNGEFHVDFLATTTKRTVVNMTNHTYFNLAGHDAGAEELYNHVIAINADMITETSDSIPTGRFINVIGTPYDLRHPKLLGDAITKQDNLFDDNYCVNKCGDENNLSFASRVVHPPSGRTLEIFTDQPGIQFYTSNSLPRPDESALVGKYGAGYRYHGALCLETQKYPDAVHHPNFPSVILSPGDVYTHRVAYLFGIETEKDEEERIRSKVQPNIVGI